MLATTKSPFSIFFFFRLLVEKVGKKIERNETEVKANKSDDWKCVIFIPWKKKYSVAVHEKGDFRIAFSFMCAFFWRSVLALSTIDDLLLFCSFTVFVCSYPSIHFNDMVACRSFTLPWIPYSNRLHVSLFEFVLLRRTKATETKKEHSWNRTTWKINSWNNNVFRWHE